MTKISTEYGYFFHISSLTFREKGLEYYQRLRITGGKNMDSIVKKLSEIESAAVSIVQHAEAEKSILDEKYDEKRRQFDLELESETKKQIQAIQDDLQKKTSQILSSQSDESLAQINALQKEYEENHTLYAQKILRKITEV